MDMRDGSSVISSARTVGGPAGYDLRDHLAKQGVSTKVTDRILASQERQALTLQRIADRLENLRPVSPIEGVAGVDVGDGVFATILAQNRSLEDKLEYVERLVNEL